MKIIALLLVILVVAVCAFRVASIISADALSMAVGMLFGVLAGIPTALLMLASGRHANRDEDDNWAHHVHPVAPWPNQPCAPTVDFTDSNHYAISQYRNQADALDVLLRCGGSLEHYGDGRVLYRAPSGKNKIFRFAEDASLDEPLEDLR